MDLGWDFAGLGRNRVKSDEPEKKKSNSDYPRVDPITHLWIKNNLVNIKIFYLTKPTYSFFPKGIKHLILNEFV